MKRIAKLIVAALGAAVILPSCSIDSTDVPEGWCNPNMVVTIRKTDKGLTYFQLDEKTTLLPVNYKSVSNNTPVRALAYCEEVNQDPAPFDKAVKVHMLEPVLTKAMVATEGSSEADAAKYGKDGIEINNSWLTVVEDGFLTISFTAYFGNIGISHYVNVVTGVDPEDPYTVELRHDAKNDYTNVQQRAGVAAFDLSSLPDTEGKTVKLTVRYRGFNADKTISFDYCTRSEK
ncbi:MAG: NigD-like protein [Bacteroidales bacterium]|nr:NigD-like protein [Bacteroidales bacterium]